MDEPSTSTQPRALEIPKMIVPDKILQQQKCSECLNYLSVGPVMTTLENKTICGRCVQIHPKKETLKKSMYDYVAQALIFKCIHHFEGCRDLTPYVKICDGNQHELHEDICAFRQKDQSLDCEECSFKAENGVQLVSHLKQHHPQVVVENNFSHTLGDQFKGLLHEQDYLFNINIYFEDNILKLLVSPYVTTTKTNNNDFKNNSLKLKLSDLKTEVIHSIEFFELIEIDVGHLKHILKQVKEVFVEVTFNQHNVLEEELYKGKLKLLDAEEKCLGYSKLREAVRRQLDLQYTTLFTCNTCFQKCKDLDVCGQGHILCETCSQCNNNCKYFKNRYVNLYKSVYAHFPKIICEWEGCNRSLEYTNYIDHQTSCNFRKYYCPVDKCNFVSHLNSFSQHFFSHASNDDFSVSFNQNENLNLSESYKFYWVLDRLLMNVVVVNFYKTTLVLLRNMSSYTSPRLQINMKNDPMVLKNYNFSLCDYSVEPVYKEHCNWNTTLINEISIEVSTTNLTRLTLKFKKR